MAGADAGVRAGDRHQHSTVATRRLGCGARLRARIHRGAREIDASCVEVEHEGARLILDVGLPLDSPSDADVPLHAVPGLAEGDHALLGVIVSHSHPDHYGLISGVHESIPIFIGQAAQRILGEATFFGAPGVVLNAAGHLRDGVPFELGPFRLTPLLVDHSAFDAYAVLVEAGGRRMLYSGDIRAHGRSSELFEGLVSSAPSHVDALLLEGTHVRDVETQAERGPSETELEDDLVGLMSRTPGMVLACYSAQNIDRLITFHRAARQAGRLLVLDLYGAYIASATGDDSIPQAGHDGVRVFVPQSQRVRVKRAAAFERTARVKPHRLFREQLATRSTELVMTFRGSMAPELESAGCLDGAAAVWSMWHGYLNRPIGQKLRRWCDSNGIPMCTMHSSGHASVRDLQRLATAIAATQVVPIHTSAPQRFAELFSEVTVREDGEWWNV